MFPDLKPLFFLALFGFFVGIPLAVWKGIEVVIWIINHVSINF